MSLGKTIKKIEGHEFSVEANVASDLRTFIFAIRSQEPIQDLLQELKNVGTRAFLLARVIRLSRERVDPRYTNQWDPALAAYLWLLARTDLSYAKLAAESVARAPQTFWASRMADGILEDAEKQFTSGDRSDESIALEKMRVWPDSGFEAGESMYVADFLFFLQNMEAHASVLGINSPPSGPEFFPVFPRAFQSTDLTVKSTQSGPAPVPVQA